jgi:uncharacterized delta-60 repeat protein
LLSRALTRLLLGLATTPIVINGSSPLDSVIRRFLFLNLVVLCAITATSSFGQAGSVDPTFNPGSGVDNNGTARVSSIALQSDGKILIGGDFTTVDGQSRPRVARLNANGSVDAQFNPGAGANGEVFSVLAQPDGKVLIAGSFTEVAGQPRNRVARLNSDGTLDAQFAPKPGANFDVLFMQLLPDRGILIGGGFDQVDNVTRNAIAQLQTNGTLNVSFDPGSGADGAVASISLRDDGKVLIAGDFSHVDDQPRPFIARLNSNGSLDSTFDPGTGPDAEVYSTKVLTNGAVLIAGTFTKVSTTPRKRIARLSPGGSLDQAFDPGSGADLDISALAIQTDEKILAGGNFSQFNSVACNSLARLNPNGSLDSNFVSGLGTDSSVQSLAVQSDGRILVGGYISTANGLPRNGIARLLGEASTATGPTLVNPTRYGDVFIVSADTVTGKSYVLEFKDSFTQTNWAELPPIAGDGTLKTLTNAPVPVSQRFYRVRVQ